ncbi:FAD-binding oxidoreductase [Sphingobium sp. AN558]|uniref:NAD(P)/FAD-dependent oxidoreductase n=1 Tax=Sphingobium sp. AN558 TaxID=3133442 RepID=UPI0030C56E64
MTSDIVIVGGGIAGASLGAKLAEQAKVTILEMEDSAGYHATGRSVAFWEETYGGPVVQPLTTASEAMLSSPDPAFSETGFLSPRQTLHVGREQDRPAYDRLLRDYAGKVELLPVSPAGIVPGLRSDWTIGLMEPSCQDIDVNALHQAYLRRVRSLGGEIRLATALRRAKSDSGGWHIETNHGAIACALVVNAAGAWADPVARACGVEPIGIQPLRRTVVQLRVPAMPGPNLPLIMDLGGRFYFKPKGAERIWLTPHDEARTEACDAAPEELAVAEAIDQFRAVVNWPIAAVEQKWAGLRSFAPDRTPVYGFDPAVPGFFWFAGQGGFGIQTAPAAAMLAATLITGTNPSGAIASLDATLYSPARFR